MLPGTRPGTSRVSPAAGARQPGQGTNSDHRDTMSLAGLLTILDTDPQLRDVVARAGSDSAPAELAGAELTGDELTGATLTGEDLVAPPSLRPVLAAALTRRAPGSRGFVL